MKRITSLLSLVAILGYALALTSCDKDANNIQLQKISGTYNGDISAELFMPDYAIETYNTYFNDNGQPSLAADTIKSGEVALTFSSDDTASFSLNHLTGIKFRINFAFVSEEDDIAVVAGNYEGGLLAKYFNGIRNHYLGGDISKSDFYHFAKLMKFVEDTISIENFSVQPFRMLERGAVYSTFDYEQNSVYVRTKINQFNYSRKSNLHSAFQFADQKFSSVMSSEEKLLAKALNDGLKQTGTVTDAEAWTSMIYTNYKPYLEVAIDQATGILDTLTKALFGEYKLDDNGNPLIDSQGNPVPVRTLMINLFYEGTIANMNSFERI